MIVGCNSKLAYVVTESSVVAVSFDFVAVNFNLYVVTGVRFDIKLEPAHPLQTVFINVPAESKRSNL